MKEGISSPDQLILPYCSADNLNMRLEESGLLTPLTKLALDQAHDSHSDRTRNSGQPYLEEHVYPVTVEVLEYMQKRLKSHDRQEIAVTASLLHDTVEDDENFEIEHCHATYGQEVSRLVYPLTKYGVDRDIYIQKLANAPKDARRIKLLDRTNNLTCSVVIAQQRPDKLRRYLIETEESYMPIARGMVDRYFAERLGRVVHLGKIALDRVELASETAA
jgi:(p)ppGpp synthase/HD superfamily hydrolase